MKSEQVSFVQYPENVLEVARDFVNSPLDFNFDEIEESLLNSFFTNTNNKVFFMHSLPANVGAVVLSMYSRLKDPRGLRGIFVDSFLPQFLATQLDEVQQNYDGRGDKFLKDNNINNLWEFIRYSGHAGMLVHQFRDSIKIDPEYLTKFAQANKAKRFLDMWLDKYGHNSIARTAGLWICCEQISILAAKSLEWTRPGSGYIELSTRYVDMSGKGMYPVEKELEAGWGIDPESILGSNEYCFSLYKHLAGDEEQYNGPFPQQLRDSYGHLYDNPKDLEMGIKGETSDVLGNLLPASTLTSLGMFVSGEAFPQVLKHLLLDNTPENIAICEAMVEESKKIGAIQFARHYEPTEWEQTWWEYLSIKRHTDLRRIGFEELRYSGLLRAEDITREVANALGLSLEGFEEMDQDRRFQATRGEYDKLPAEFEAVSLLFDGIMSFRGWRDLHRMGFCTHFRTLLTPHLGFYQYDKPVRPEQWQSGISDIEEMQIDIYQNLERNGVPAVLAQYPLCLGWNVGFRIGANLREWEFCNWQRCKPAVNHEVRQVFLSAENYLRRMLPWWGKVSRADATPAYIFARGFTEVPLSQYKEAVH